jgi:hypothetical protein
VARAQDLVPGAYTPAPAGFNIVTIAASLSVGGLVFDPSVPIKDGHSTIGGGFIGLNRTMNIAGRSANIGVGLPYLLGHIEGLVAGEFREGSRSGLGDLPVRVAVNLYGAPAMTRQQFAANRATTIVGISLTVGVPTGQYDPGRVINIGTHRWSVKPEVGSSRRRGRWTFEGASGVSFFTDNTNYVNGGTRRQAPIVSVQGHIIYTFRPNFWIASNGNLWYGGRLTTNGIEATELQRNSRLGVTLAVPIARRQVRIAYSFGAYTRLGGDFQSVGVSYSYAWFGRP